MRKLVLSIFTIVLSYYSYSQRNVVLIIADDLGTDYLGCYEDYKDTVDVPNIRALLKKGVRFSNAMSNPVCSSTRSGILTGRYSFRTGVGGIVGGAGGSNQLDTSEITIPRLLKKFNTNIAKANIGKWHLHQATPASNLLNPNKMGYDHFEGPFIGQLPSFTNWTKYTNGVSSNVTTYATTENVNNAVSWLKQQNSKPFFLWLAFNAPHAPYHLPPANLHSYTTLSGTTLDISKNPKSYFKAMLQALDHEIGRFYDSLKKMNRYDSTDFIFIGDNGNTIQTAQITNTAKAKGTVYQYGVHVPFIIAGPSVVNPGRKSDALINTTDIFATVLDLFGDKSWPTLIPSNKPVDSKSIFPILKNTSTEIRPWQFCENFKLTPDSTDGKAMRNKEFKLIKLDYGKEEFYNLNTDPDELNDLLKGNLSSIEQTNFNYLCSEMTKLIGKGSFCNSSSDIKNIVDQKSDIYPNPFHSYIRSESFTDREIYELTDCVGQILFTGKNIELQNFSNLPNGIYFLKISNKKNQTIKLLKE